MILSKRMAMNNLKQQWKEFGEWVINYYGYNDLNIDECVIVLNIHLKTKKKKRP